MPQTKMALHLTEAVVGGVDLGVSGEHMVDHQESVVASEAVTEAGSEDEVRIPASISRSHVLFSVGKRCTDDHCRTREAI